VPYKLILVKLGNTSKKELIHFFETHFTEIIERINTENMVLLQEISNISIFHFISVSFLLFGTLLNIVFKKNNTAGIIGE